MIQLDVIRIYIYTHKNIVFMYIYIYIHICIYTYVYIYKYTYDTCIQICIYIYIYTHTYLYLCTPPIHFRYRDPILNQAFVAGALAGLRSAAMAARRGALDGISPKNR